MTQIAIVYHSKTGNTKTIAEEIAKGAASVSGVTTHMVSVTDGIDWELLNGCDGIIFGSPTYLASVTAEFKAFMDSSSDAWFNQKWKDKIAAGFTTSHSFSGDKLSTLMQMVLFAAQHTMVWVGQTEKREGGLPAHVNRLGSYLGLMAQSDPTLEEEMTPPSGDRKTAFLFGARVAQAAKTRQ